MKRTCPTCNQPLPEVETLIFRFCPHCGAEIEASPQPLDEAFLTEPPDPALPPADAEPQNIESAGGQTASDGGRFDDRTVAPLPINTEKRPQIKPPAEPPPPGFLRTPPSEPHATPPEPKRQQAKKAEPPPPDPLPKTAAPIHSRVIVAVLIVLALVILLLGGLFTF